MSRQSEEVRKYFDFNGIKQSTIAAKMGMDRTTLSNILAGRRKFNEDVAKKLHDLYGFDIAYLMIGEGSLFPSGAATRSAGAINHSAVTQGDNSPITINAGLEAENARLRAEVEWLRGMLEKTAK